MDCSHETPKDNCMQWNAHVNPTLNSTVMGLTPEDPIIVDSRLDYPFAQVVPLAPIVWQTRAPRVPCSGFGDTYNRDILGAGLCTPFSPCNPDSVTSFDASVPNPYTERLQSVFVTYEEDAFYCIDRREEETTFYDRS